MESAEREGNINTVEQLQNTEVNTSNNASKKQKQSHGAIYSCNYCEFTGSSSGLRKHQSYKHEGVRYSCDPCKYFVSDASNLRRHINTKHKEVRYQCEQCEYVAFQASSLKLHKAARHEVVSYLCDQCEYSTSNASSSKRHTRIKHTEINTVMYTFYFFKILNICLH